MEELLTNNRILRQRSVDIGVLTKQEAIEWGCTGPILRSAGVPWDLRRAQPYDAYNELDFWGIAPGIFYNKCTSIFYKDNNCLGI